MATFRMPSTCSYAQRRPGAGGGPVDRLSYVTYSALDMERLRNGEIKFPGGIEAVPYALENRRLLSEIYDLFPELGADMLPFVMVDPMREPKAQAAELRKTVRALPLPWPEVTNHHPAGTRQTPHGCGEGFSELAAEWDLPFLIHSSIADSDLWAQCGDILDVAEANPHLRFLLAHSCRYDKPSLDRVNELPNTFGFDNSAHCIHCEGVVEGDAVCGQKAPSI